MSDCNLGGSDAADLRVCGGERRAGERSQGMVKVKLAGKRSCLGNDP